MKFVVHMQRQVPWKHRDDVWTFCGRYGPMKQEVLACIDSVTTEPTKVTCGACLAVMAVQVERQLQGDGPEVVRRRGRR